MVSYRLGSANKKSQPGGAGWLTDKQQLVHCTCSATSHSESTLAKSMIVFDQGWLFYIHFYYSENLKFRQVGKQINVDFLVWVEIRTSIGNENVYQ